MSNATKQVEKDTTILGEQVRVGKVEFANLQDLTTAKGKQAVTRVFLRCGGELVQVSDWNRMNEYARGKRVELFTQRVRVQQGSSDRTYENVLAKV